MNKDVNLDKKLFSVKYKLSREELTQTLRLMRGKKARGKSIFQTVLAGIAILLCVIRIMDNPSNPLFYSLCAICLILAAASWIMPGRIEEKMFNSGVQGVEIQFTLTTSELFFLTDQQTAAYILPLDGKLFYRENENLILLYTSETRVMAVPKRALNAGQLELLQKKLQKGAVRQTGENRNDTKDRVYEIPAGMEPPEDGGLLEENPPEINDMGDEILTDISATADAEPVETGGKP